METEEYEDLRDEEDHFFKNHSRSQKDRCEDNDSVRDPKTYSLSLHWEQERLTVQLLLLSSTFEEL
jgi:hypothetical protein